MRLPKRTYGLRDAAFDALIRGRRVKKKFERMFHHALTEEVRWVNNYESWSGGCPRRRNQLSQVSYRYLLRFKSSDWINFSLLDRKSKSSLYTCASLPLRALRRPRGAAEFLSTRRRSTSVVNFVNQLYFALGETFLSVVTDATTSVC